MSVHEDREAWLEFQAWARDNPADWAELVLGVQPWHQQREVMDALALPRAEVAVKTCHAWGKDFTSSCVVPWFLLNFPWSKTITTAPTNRQVYTILWPEIRKRWAGKLYEYDVPDPLKTQWEIAEGWFALGFSTKENDATRFQGQHAEGGLLAIADEAAGISKHIFDEGINAILTGGGRFLAIGNPTDAQSEFAKMFKREGTTKFTCSAFDTPNFLECGVTLEDILSGGWREKEPKGGWPYPFLVDPHWVAKVADPNVWGTDSPMWQSRVLANFPDESPNQLFPSGLWERCANAELDWRWDDETRLGLDVARQGDDASSLFRRKGPVARREWKKRKLSTTFLAGEVAQAYRSLDAKAVCVDADGLGAGVCDVMRDDFSLNVGEVHGGGKPKRPDMFYDRRSELAWELRERAQRDALDLDGADEVLAGQLTSIRYSYQKGRIKVESKDEYKKRTGRGSPDDFDALMYAFADPEHDRPAVLVGGSIVR